MVTNTMKVIEETRKKINPMYDMCIKNADDIFNSSTDSEGAIFDSFILGYAQGMKAAKAEMKKQAKAVTV